MSVMKKEDWSNLKQIISEYGSIKDYLKTLKEDGTTHSDFINDDKKETA